MKNQKKIVIKFDLIEYITHGIEKYEFIRKIID